MADARYRVPASDPDYGPTCTVCAGPKAKQARTCRPCHRDRRLRGELPNPPVLYGAERPNWKGGVSLPKSGSHARPQSQSHPWRSRNALLFVKRRTA